MSDPGHHIGSQGPFQPQNLCSRNANPTGSGCGVQCMWGLAATSSPGGSEPCDNSVGLVDSYYSETERPVCPHTTHQSCVPVPSIYPFSRASGLHSCLEELVFSQSVGMPPRESTPQQPMQLNMAAPGPACFHDLCLATGTAPVLSDFLSLMGPLWSCLNPCLIAPVLPFKPFSLSSLQASSTNTGSLRGEPCLCHGCAVWH